MKVPRAALFPCALSLALLLGSCALPRSARTEKLPVAMPAEFSVKGEAPPADRWWETFDDADLNALMERALAGNLDLQLWWARLDKARASARHYAGR